VIDLRVAIIYNKDRGKVINVFGMQNKEVYNPKVVKRVAESLEKNGHNVEIIDGNMEVFDKLKDFFPRVGDEKNRSIVFNMAYGIQGESRYTHIPSMLEMSGIPYVGSNPSGHALALDKVITKIILQKNNLPTPDFWVFSSKSEDMSDVKYPVIVKPKMESVSFGLRVVDNEEDLRDAVEFIISEFHQQALVEQFIQGREFAVGLIGNNPVETFPVLEIDLEGDPNAIQTVDDKQHKPKNKICPAEISEDLAKEMQEISKKVFTSLGLRDFARVDIRLGLDNEIYVLEVNSMASLGFGGSYVAAAKAYGLDYEGLVNKMLDVASMRYFNLESLKEKSTGKRIPTKVKIRSYLRTREDYIIKVINDFVDTNTYSQNIEGVNKFGNSIKSKLSSLGFTAEVFPQSQVGNVLYLTNTDNPEVDVLLVGNLDNTVKPEKHKYFQDRENRLYGTGVWEHKGGIASALLALQSLKYTKKLKNKKIGILLTTDDLMQGRFSKKIIKDKSKNAKVILGLNGAFIHGGMVTSRSGSAKYKISMNMKKFTKTEDVAKAVNVFIETINKMVKQTDEDKGVVISPSKMNVSSNITEPYFHGDSTLNIRFGDPELYTTFDDKIRKIIPERKYKNVYSFQIEGSERRPPMQLTAETEEKFEELKKIADDLDIIISSDHRWSSNNIAFCDSAKPIIDGFGPSGKKEFSGREYVFTHNIIEKAHLIAVFIDNLK
jgi:D-alanine-D-alanine ligase